MSLTASQRQTAAEHARLPEVIADLVYSDRADRDERLSSAGLALCLSARKWEPGTAQFETYAWRSMVRSVRRAAARERPCARLGRADQIEDRPTGPSVEDRDMACVIESLFDILTDRERRVIELYRDGWRWIEIAEILGVTRGAVERTRRRAANKIRNALR